MGPSKNRKNFDKAIGVLHMRPVRLRDLRFPVDKHWLEDTNYISRLASRIVAKRYLNGKADSYQGSYISSLPINIQISKFQMAHWTLRNAGYSVCVADLEKVCGLNPYAKK